MPRADRNQARFVFLDPHARELYTDWEAVAADTAAMLRVDAGRHPEDPALGQLVGDLSLRSPEFRRLWARNRVHERRTGIKRYHHPIVGDVMIGYQALSPAGDPDQTLLVYHAEPGTPSADALRILTQSRTGNRMPSAVATPSRDVAQSGDGPAPTVP